MQTTRHESARLKPGDDGYDPKYWFRPLYDGLRKALVRLVAELFFVGGMAAMDEYLNGSNHHVSYRRTLKGKPGKGRGLLYYVMCSTVEFFDKEGNEIKGDKLFLPHFFGLYTANEPWRRVKGPRGGRGNPPPQWRGYGEGGCFLLDFIAELTASGALKAGTTIVGDRLFTSFHLLKRLKDLGLFYLGTAKRNVKGIPDMDAPTGELTWRSWGVRLPDVSHLDRRCLWMVA